MSILGFAVLLLACVITSNQTSWAEDAFVGQRIDLFTAPPATDQLNQFVIISNLTGEQACFRPDPNVQWSHVARLTSADVRAIRIDGSFDRKIINFFTTSCLYRFPADSMADAVSVIDFFKKNPSAVFYFVAESEARCPEAIPDVEGYRVPEFPEIGYSCWVKLTQIRIDY